MILDDFVMLGKTVPEVNSDSRLFVCTAGWSCELGQPIRIYPMARRNCPPRWSWSRIPLERNAKDSRRESWKIRGDRSVENHAEINQVIEPVYKTTPPEKQKEIIRKLTVGSLKEANDRRLSLCVICPQTIPQIEMEEGKLATVAPAQDMFCAPEKPVAERFPWHPRITFKDADGDHNLMLREWGCYELMRKKPEWSRQHLPFHLSEALSLCAAPPLLCGNLNSFRNSWLVISVFHGAVHARPEVFDQSPDLFSGLSQ